MSFLDELAGLKKEKVKYEPPKPPKPRVNETNKWKKMVRELEFSIKELENSLEVAEIQRRIDKEGIDHLSKLVEKFKFDPDKYANLIRVISVLHVNANKSQIETLETICGSSAIVVVRKWIVDVLNEPYRTK